MQIKYYEPEENRLIYIYKEATKEYWDELWKSQIQKNLNKSRISKWNYVIRKTKKYLPKCSKLLEGGCGNGIQVFKLHKSGFHTVGLDYSPLTINYLKKNYTELNFTQGDVRDIPFDDEYFDGYWSFGVIEHYYEGYKSIVKEMYRVIKPGKYLFLAFPHMSKIRRRKARRGKYPIWVHHSDGSKDFFQFALDEDNVIKDVENNGFYFIEKKKLSGLSGLRDEAGFFLPIIDKIYNCKVNFVKPIKTIISIILTHHFSNSILLIFRKKTVNTSE